MLTNSKNGCNANTLQSIDLISDQGQCIDLVEADSDFEQLEVPPLSKVRVLIS